ncbi:glutathione transferase GstA [Parachitinimonas caeni]|uniref:Glutathione transferase GstA n=1 Tax=Parachitinimonas caeni TaxID=3031301 RepID=A0ABT7DQV0_9NEIS|nr:glutathione transferase GstA [Parachitinimonas caeni]MDK2122449.1 glutathione transferase GstA [Parachitinimonas caeni]
MKLFYSPGACSLASHIVLHESGLAFETEKVDLRSHKTAGGVDFYSINDKGYVPALMLNDGELLTEGPAIGQYLADLVSSKQLLPPAGSLARVKVQEWLTFIGTEIHKSFGPLWYPTVPEETKQAARAALDKRFKLVEQRLAGKDYLMGASFSVADPYLFVMLSWCKFHAISLEGFPNLQAFMARMADRPGVQAALKAEGLM